METSLHTRVTERMEALGLNALQAARNAGLGDSFVRDIMRGKVKSPSSDNMIKLAKALGTTHSWLMTGEGPVEPLEHEPNGTIGDKVKGGPVRIKVYGQAVGGVDGEFEMNGNVIDIVLAPPQISEISDAYAVIVSGDSMSPRYEDGETAFIDPRRRPRRGDYVIAQIRKEEYGAPLAYIKRFERHNQNELVLSQFNPPKELAFPANQVVSVHFIALAGIA